MFDATSLIVEFHNHFLVQELFNATTVIYPQYWVLPQVEITFPRHLAIIQAYFEHQKAKLGTFGNFVGPILNLILFNQYSSFLKLTMYNNCWITMVFFHNSYPTTKLWKKLGLNTIFNHHLSKWINSRTYMHVYGFGYWRGWIDVLQPCLR
jgi:hypothetical protein